jgi:exosortase H (IPTLxxWG-CTERM-specific)
MRLRFFKSAGGRYAIKFLLLLFIYYAIATTVWWNQWLYQYLRANAWISGWILNQLGAETTVQDLVIRSDRFSIAVKKGCDAVEPGWIFAAALLAFPTAWKKKLLGMIVGLSFLMVLNLMRVMSLYWIGTRYGAFFNTAHLEVWPALFILVSALLVALWLRWVKPKK